MTVAVMIAQQLDSSNQSQKQANVHLVELRVGWMDEWMAEEMMFCDGARKILIRFQHFQHIAISVYHGLLVLVG